MRKFIGLFGLIVGLFLLNFGFSQGSASKSQSGGVTPFEVDPAHTEVNFSVRHMVLSRVSGEFKDFNVDLKWNAENLEDSHIEAYIKTASIDTDKEKRDNHLKSPDFLHAEEYPEIVFKSKNIEKTDNGYVAHGDLAIRGLTKEVMLPFNVLGKFVQPDGKTRIGFEANLTINRFDYNVSWDKLLDTGGLVVGEDVEIDIQAEFLSAETS
jgi:polyisoprenoid-binding protein YceI